MIQSCVISRKKICFSNGYDHKLNCQLRTWPKFVYTKKKMSIHKTIQNMNKLWYCKASYTSRFRVAVPPALPRNHATPEPAISPTTLGGWFVGVLRYLIMRIKLFTNQSYITLVNPWSQPLITSPLPNVNLKGWPLSLEESNFLPFCSVPV